MFLKFLTGIAVVFFITIVSNLSAQTVIQNDSVYTQEGDSVKAVRAPKNKDKGPRRATIMSAVLPGLGQVYNKKYWKVPIIYGLGGLLVYFVSDNRGYYQAFRKAYNDTTLILSNKQNGIPSNFQVKGTSYKEVTDFGRYSPEQLKQRRNLFQRNMQLNVILIGGLYILNVIDAAVDAHLKSFNVNENLSMKIDPSIHFHPISGVAPGLNLTLAWRK